MFEKIDFTTINLQQKFQYLNQLGKKREPFFFVIDYDLQNIIAIKLSELPDDICFSLDNQTSNQILPQHQIKSKQTITFCEYKKQFDKLQEQIKLGNTYLANLTTSTQIKTSLSLKQIYNISNAKYKIYYKDQFISLSPERFINIANNKIYTYPMKGTIDANIPNAQNIILQNKKELSEHTMVVDLLRNDISIVAKNTQVEKFRYIQKIQAGSKELLQVSSKISATFDYIWQDHIGDILYSLLPAGSISGTPKKSTINILSNIESHKRGFFTGIFGVFQNNTLDSAVMIRYIQKENNNLIYKSGGGITIDSICEDEFQEMCDKVYIS
jgi:para-aminobenzoate synthetase component 1